MDGGGAHGVWGTAEEAGLLQPQEEKATKVSNGSLLVPNRGNADGARLLVYVLNEGTRGHSHVTARQSLIRFKRKKGKLIKHWKGLTREPGKSPSSEFSTLNRTRSWATWYIFKIGSTLSRMLDQMTPRGPFPSKLICDISIASSHKTWNKARKAKSASQHYVQSQQPPMQHYF